MGQRRINGLWPRPRTTRHVWVSQSGLQVPPVQGFVVEWKRWSYHWWALVLTVHVPGQGAPLTTMEWLPVERLTPVKSDPNDGRAHRIF